MEEKIEGIQYKERAGVYGIAFNGEWHIALVNTPRGYSLPGGGIEAGECFNVLKMESQVWAIREAIKKTASSVIFPSQGYLLSGGLCRNIKISNELTVSYLASGSLRDPLR